MTTAQELDRVINALSRTISELRETKEKLERAEAINKQNLEVKKNLALRIDELEKRVDSVRAKAAEELKAEQRKTEYFERLLSHSLCFNTPTADYLNVGMKFGPSVDFITDRRPFYPTSYEYQVYWPAMMTRFTVNEDQIRRWQDHFPYIRESIARKMADDHSKHIHREVSKLLQEVKCPASK